MAREVSVTFNDEVVVINDGTSPEIVIAGVGDGSEAAAPEVASATELEEGIIRIATSAEVDAGSNDTAAITPLKMEQRLSDFDPTTNPATETVAGLVYLATQNEVNTGTNAEDAVTPATLAGRTATTGRRGLVELATDSETNAGSDTERAVTPSNLEARTATESRRGLIELATQSEAEAIVDTERAVAPLRVAQIISSKGSALLGLSGGSDALLAVSQLAREVAALRREIARQVKKTLIIDSGAGNQVAESFDVTSGSSIDQLYSHQFAYNTVEGYVTPSRSGSIAGVLIDRNLLGAYLYSANFDAQGVAPGVAFDGVTKQAFSIVPKFSLPANGSEVTMFGKDWGVGVEKVIQRAMVYGASDRGLLWRTDTNARMIGRFALYGSETDPNGIAQAGVQLSEYVLSKAKGAEILTLTNTRSLTGYRYTWVTAQNHLGPPATFYPGELQFYEGPSPNNMVLLSNEYTAPRNITVAHMIAEIDVLETMTLNVDIIFEFAPDTRSATIATGGSPSTAGAQNTNPCIIRSPSHGFETGNNVYIAGVLGMTQLNGQDYTITKLDNDFFSLNGVNATAYGVYTSGGKAIKATWYQMDMVDKTGNVFSRRVLESLNKAMVVAGRTPRWRCRTKNNINVNLHSMDVTWS